MESSGPDMEQARKAFKDAVAGLSRALTRFFSADGPLTHDRASLAEQWTGSQVLATVALKQAWITMVETRTVYEEVLISAKLGDVHWLQGEATPPW